MDAYQKLPTWTFDIVLNFLWAQLDNWQLQNGWTINTFEHILYTCSWMNFKNINLIIVLTCPNCFFQNVSSNIEENISPGRPHQVRLSAMQMRHFVIWNIAEYGPKTVVMVAMPDTVRFAITKFTFFHLEMPKIRTQGERWKEGEKNKKGKGYTK